MSALGGVGPNAVLCKICSMLLCVLEQPRIDNSRVLGPITYISIFNYRDILNDKLSFSLVCHFSGYSISFFLLYFNQIVSNIFCYKKL